MEADVLCEGRASFSLDLHPAYVENVLEGVHLQLGSRLLRWDEELGGVLLAYSNIEKLPTEAAIRPYFVYIQLKVAARVLLFKPRVGAVICEVPEICGRVTKLGMDFIGMTVLGSINAAVGRQNIRPDLQYQVQADVWASAAEPSHTIGVGADVLFCIESLRVDGNGVLAILGTMKENWTGTAQRAAMACSAAFRDPARWQTGLPASTGLEASLTPSSMQGRRHQQHAASASEAGQSSAAQQLVSNDAAQNVELSHVAPVVPKAKKKRKQRLAPEQAEEGYTGQAPAEAKKQDKRRRKEQQARAPEPEFKGGEVAARGSGLPNGILAADEAEEAKPSSALVPSEETPRKKKKKKKRKQQEANAAQEGDDQAAEKKDPSLQKTDKSSTAKDAGQNKSRALPSADLGSSEGHVKRSDARSVRDFGVRQQAEKRSKPKEKRRSSS